MILWPVLTVLPWVTNCAIFVSIYTFMPNTRVKWVSALIGGIVGGSAWHIAQSLYVHFSLLWFGDKYNAIYESFAWIFVLIVWVSISWTILLLGAELAAAHQHLDRYRRRHRPWRETPEEIETLALRLAALLVPARWSAPSPALSARSGRVRQRPARHPEEPVGRVIKDYESIGLVARIRNQEGPDEFVMCRSPEEVSVLDLLRVVRHGSLDPTEHPHFGERVLYEAERDFAAWLAGRPVSTLAALDPRRSGPSSCAPRRPTRTPRRPRRPPHNSKFPIRFFPKALLQVSRHDNDSRTYQ